MSAEDRSGDTGGVPSIIGTDLKIVGDLKSTGDIQIDGTIEGNIEGPLLTVTEQGKIDGSTVANTVLIFGTVNGQVQAKTVHLRSGAGSRPTLSTNPSPWSPAPTSRAGHIS